MEYTASVSLKVGQQDGKTVYSDFDAQVNGKRYSEDLSRKDYRDKEEEERMLERLYKEMEALHKKYRNRRRRII